MDLNFMAKLREKIEAEIENIEKVLSLLGQAGQPNDLSTIELAGLASFVHNFYNGIENILKQILISTGEKIPDSPSWHSDLLKTAVDKKIISLKLAKNLKGFLAFRHFFSHAYSFDIDKKLLMPLVKRTRTVYKNFLNEIQNFR